MENWQDNRILSAKDGTNPMLLAEMKAGYAVFGDVQFLPGYCVLLPKKEYRELNDMPLEERTQFLQDMSVLGDAIKEVCQPLRMNYDILGNTDNYVHAHIFPRYDWEDEVRRKKPVWLYPEGNWIGGEFDYSEERHFKLKEAISNELKKKNP